MKSLHKTFDILEYILLQNGKHVTPSEAAESLGINLATCTRIMGELVQRGYLEKVSRKSGYIAGPMTAALNTRDHLYKKLAEAAEEPIRNLSEKLNCQVNLSVLHQNHRIMLTFHLPGFPAVPWNTFRFSDHLDTATGRLLLASLEDSAARKVCASCGIKPYPKEELQQIRKDGFVQFDFDSLSIIGCLIYASGYPTAAFGFGVPPEKAGIAFEFALAAAAEIRKKLTVSACQAY